MSHTDSEAYSATHQTAVKVRRKNRASKEYTNPTTNIRVTVDRGKKKKKESKKLTTGEALGLIIALVSGHVLLDQVGRSVKSEGNGGFLASTILRSLTDPGTTVAKAFMASKGDGVFDERTNITLGKDTYTMIVTPMKKKYKENIKMLILKDAMKKNDSVMGASANPLHF